jgi:glycosyltransferase involved in cell wall biosynthesis
MLIGLNLLHAHKGVGGVWNYIESLVKALGDYGHQHQFICYCTTESEPLVPEQPNFEVKKTAFSSTNRLLRILYENTVLPIHINRDNIDCLHWFANTLGFFCSPQSIVTIYDIMVYEKPDDYSTFHRIYLKNMIPRTVRLATMLAPMSNSTAEAISRRFNQYSTRQAIIPPIINNNFKEASQEKTELFKRKYDLPDKFWLYVAHFYPHKNHARLFKALAYLKAQCSKYWPLVLRGDKKDQENVIERYLAENHIMEDVIWLPRLNVAEMPLLYSSATALVFPSTFEGGGIPVMEAMACGCPVIASRIPTNIEFAGDAALLCDPLLVDSITSAMKRFTIDSELRASYKKRGLSAAAKLRPHMVAQTLLGAYEEMIQA